MVEKFDQSENKDTVVDGAVTGTQAITYSPDTEIHKANDEKIKSEEIPNPEDFYDAQNPESKETLGSVKVYKIKNIKNVGFGKRTESADKQLPYQIDFAVNGPLVGDDGKPVGGYIDNGVAKKPFIDPMSLPKDRQGNFADNNGIFGCDKNGKMHIVPYKDIGNTTIDWKWAFQNGPILLRDGKNPHTEKNPSREKRSGIGFTSTGEAMVIYSETPVNLREFGQIFKNKGCTNAMYLDGGNRFAGYQDATGKHGHFNDDAIKLQFYVKKQ